MKNLDLLILDTCFDLFQNGNYTTDAELLFEKLKSLCLEEDNVLSARVEYLWEQNYLESSNGRYYLTDQALQLLNNLKLKK